jgi:hypothetical protein
MFRRLNRPKLRRSDADILSLRDDKGDRLRDVVLELLADGGSLP